ncbi:helix-turn-helix domain-containing protein [Paraburkholderia silviterrae]|nr:helix-turn-helix domain-containing protein [Paraburkholderia silviterrae]
MVSRHLSPTSCRSPSSSSRALTRKRLSADAAAHLIRYGWPGNVRELKNAMERVAVMVRGEYIHAIDLAFLQSERSGAQALLDWPDEDLPSALARLEEMLIRRALVHSNNNRTDAARRLNVNRQLLYAKLKRYGIEGSDEKGGEGEEGAMACASGARGHKGRYSSPVAPDSL